MQDEPADRLARLLTGADPRIELARLVHVPDRDADAAGKRLVGDGAGGAGRHGQMADHGAVRLHDEGAVIAGEDLGLDPQSGRGAARRLQRPPGDHHEEGAGRDDLGDRFAGAGNRRRFVVEQGPVQIAGEQERFAGTSAGCVHPPLQARPAADGSSTVKRAPPPAASSAVIEPPCASTSPRQTARPRPAPDVPRASWAR